MNYLKISNLGNNFQKDQTKTWELLMKSFPSKKALSVQNDLFADRRARALDAYLQILWVVLGKNQSNEELINRNKDLESIVEKFFEGPLKYLKITENVSVKSQSQIQTHPLRTPNVLIGVIERLTAELVNLNSLNPKFEDEFSKLQAQIRELERKEQPKQAKNSNSEDLRCINKFYDLKREIEIWRVKTGQVGKYFEDSFSLRSKNEKNPISRNKTTIRPNSKLNEPSEQFSTSDDFENTKHYLRGQEAILSDLACTLKQQKDLSQEIWTEIKDHNRILESFSDRQEETMEGFKKADTRVKKIQ